MMCSEHSSSFSENDESKQNQQGQSWHIRALIGSIRLYQNWISPLTGPTCRFEPTCSSYALEAVQRYGAFKGVVFAIVRISKCGPWHPGGFDPVPKGK